MRSINSLKSILTSLISNFCNILLGFILQRILIKVLGIEYAGLNSVFANIIAMLAVVDLGIGVAISSHLYEPLKSKNTEKIKSLISLYKKCFYIIGVVISLIGLAMIPFLKYIIGETTVTGNITLFYIIYLIDTVFSYFLIYKRSILQADQKAYTINIIHLICIILMYSIQIFVLVFLKSYIIYLIIKVIFRLLENIIISYKANKIYPYLKDKNVKKLDKDTLNEIIKKVKALLLHKVGAFIVNSSDNLIITKILGLVVTGIYSNYNLIITSLNSLFNQAFASITGSLGNLIVEKDNEKTYSIYKKLLFLNSWTYSFFVTAFFCLINPFIKIWVGGEYLLGNFVVIIIVINFYLQGVRNTINLFKDTAGIFYEDRFMPIVEVIVNLIVSIVLAKLIGLAGVLIGTIVSTLIVTIYGHAKYVYKPLFSRNRISYIKEHCKYIILSSIDLAVAYIIVNYIKLDNNYMQFIINAIIAIIIPNLINYIILRNTDEFKYYKLFISGIVKKLKERFVKKDNLKL